MKYLLIVFLLLASFYTAEGKRHNRGEPRSEAGLMNNVIGCLSHKDSIGYYYLFPPFDSLWALALYHKSNSAEEERELNHLKQHPKSLLQFDPYYNHSIMSRFLHILEKGEDSGIHWKDIVMQRYILTKESPTRDLIGYDRIVPERFKGYLFVRDLLGRFTFCITISEIQKIHGYFFGGQIVNILEASTVDEYLRKEENEKKYFEWLSKNKVNDSTHNDSLSKGLIVEDSAAVKKRDYLSLATIDEDTFKARREVADRKYYEGYFDDEIPAKLYIRYMKDLRTGKITAYDGLYKFGDQVNYVKLLITRSEDGVWLMEDDTPIGTMEMELKDKVYWGSWTNNTNGSGYDVEMKQTDISQHKLEQLEAVLEKGWTGRVDEDVIPHKRKVEKKEE